MCSLASARYCPICDRDSDRFLPFGLKQREDAQCPNCLSLERHRLSWVFLQKRTDLFSSLLKTLLHIAPEQCFEPRFRAHLGDNYTTADLESPTADVRMDIMDIRYPDCVFDAIYCSHVLEHVSDDQKAMRELYRVLKVGGWAILLVPIYSNITFEDPTIVDPEQRVKAFGQHDHVRRYGPDYADRLTCAGFQVTTCTVKDLAAEEDAKRMGLTKASGQIFYCQK